MSIRHFSLPRSEVLRCRGSSAPYIFYSPHISLSEALFQCSGRGFDFVSPRHVGSLERGVNLLQKKPGSGSSCTNTALRCPPYSFVEGRSDRVPLSRSVRKKSYCLYFIDVSQCNNFPIPVGIGIVHWTFQTTSQRGLGSLVAWLLFLVSFTATKCPSPVFWDGRFVLCL